MKYLFLYLIVIMFSVKVNAQNTWLHVSYSWAKDDMRLFALPDRLAYPIINHEKNDGDNGTFEYSFGVIKKTSILKYERNSVDFNYGVVYANEVQTYTKYINSGYFVQSDWLFAIPDPTFHRYYNKQMVFPMEIIFNRKSERAEFYFGMSIKTSFSFEKKVLGTWGFVESNNLYLRRKFEFYKVSLNPKIGFVIGRFDMAMFWRWTQFSAFDTAIYHFSNYAASNSKDRVAFANKKYEWFNPFKIGMSLRYRL